LGIEANHHLVANNDCRSRTALVFLHQLAHGGKIAGYVAHFEIDSSLREESLRNMAGRSARLAEYDNFMFLHIDSILANELG